MSRTHILDKPVFTISLDFELMWGVFDKRTISTYGKNINGVHSAIPKILKLFSEYNVHATWASVGCLFYSSLDELKADLPAIQPGYLHDRFSAYSHIKTIAPADFSQYYSGIELVGKIKATAGQEVGTHTFSHYYCREEGQTAETFKADIQKAVERAKELGITIRSIVFPRNQYNEDYLHVCAQQGIVAYRGNEKNFIQKPRNQDELNMAIRLLRFSDTYINTTGHNVYKELAITDDGMIDIPASFFFRPYNGRSAWMEAMKIRRYKKAMLYAAKTKSLFHLWWHPHNFGTKQDENLAQLQQVLEYYRQLHTQYGMQSMHMAEIADEIISAS